MRNPTTMGNNKGSSNPKFQLCKRALVAPSLLSDSLSPSLHFACFLPHIQNQHLSPNPTSFLSPTSLLQYIFTSHPFSPRSANSFNQNQELNFHHQWRLQLYPNPFSQLSHLFLRKASRMPPYHCINQWLGNLSSNKIFVFPDPNSNLTRPTRVSSLTVPQLGLNLPMLKPLLN